MSPQPVPLDINDIISRKKMYGIIYGRPGIHFRELERETGFASGTVQYHLGEMVRSGLLTEVKEGHYTRYYIAQMPLSPQDKKLMSALRRELPRGMILFILEHPGCENREIARRFVVSAPTITYHLKRLLAAGVVKAEGDTRMQRYSLVDRTRAVEVMLAYRKSFVDSMIDAFLDGWLK
jgi:predicted transcriptional regulator